jgi:flagellar protein FlgJ
MDIKMKPVDPALLTGPKIENPKKTDPEALRRACQQFEAILVQELFKGMRATVSPAGLLEESRSSEIFQELMDQQVAEEVSRRQGLGLAEAMFRQLKGKE